MLVFAVAPVAAGTLVQELGESFGQAVGEGFDHDGVVIVELLLELLGQLRGAESGRDGKSAQIIVDAGTSGRNIVGQAAEILLPFALPLLAEHAETDQFFGAVFISVNDDIVAL